jgi:hypothetical protein
MTSARPSDRIIRAKHCHRRAQANSFGAPRDRGQQDLGGRYREIGPVVFADAEKVDTQIVGKNRLVDDVANDLRMRQWIAIMSGRDITKSIKSKLKTYRHVSSLMIL